MLTEYNLLYGTLAMYLYIVLWFISVKKQKWIKLLLIDVLLVVPFVLLMSTK